MYRKVEIPLKYIKDIAKDEDNNFSPPNFDFKFTYDNLVNLIEELKKYVMNMQSANEADKHKVHNLLNEKKKTKNIQEQNVKKIRETAKIAVSNSLSKIQNFWSSILSLYCLNYQNKDKCFKNTVDKINDFFMNNLNDLIKTEADIDNIITYYTEKYTNETAIKYLV